MKPITSFHRFRMRAARVFGVSCFVALQASAFTQGLLTPNWVAGGWSQPSEHPKYSADGTKLLVWRANAGSTYNPTMGALGVYRVSDGTALARFVIDGNTGDLTSATFSQDGTLVYVGTTTGIFTCNISTQKLTLLTSGGASTGNGPRYMETTTNSATKDSVLGYILKDTVSGYDRVLLYDLTKQALVGRFSIVNPGSSNTTGGFKFLANGTEVVVSGPNVYDYTGKAIGATHSSNAYDFAVSPDQATIYTTDPSGQGNVAAFNATGVTEKWSIASPGLFGSASVTRDSKAVLFTSQQAGQWTVTGLSSTGAGLAQTVVIPVPSASAAPFLAASPTADQILVGPETEPTAQVWNYSSATGSGTLVGTFFAGSMEQRDPSILGITAVIGGKTLPALADTEFHPFINYSTDTNRVVIRNAVTGAIVGGSMPDGATVSPDGNYYAIVTNTNSTGNVAIYSTADGSAIDSTSVPNTLDTGSLRWAQNGRIIVQWGSYYNGGTLVFNFDGSFLTESSVTIPDNDTEVKISPDGSRVVYTDSSGNSGYRSATLYDPTTGKVIAAIPPDANSWGIDNVTFSHSTPLLLGVHEVVSTGSIYQTIEYRVFDVSGAVPKQVGSTIRYSTGFDVRYSSGASLSPNGATVALGFSGLSSASDPRRSGSVLLYSFPTGGLLQEWDNQFVPDFGASYDAFTFAADNSALFWSVDASSNTNNGAIVSAPLVPFKLTLAMNPATVLGGVSSTGTLTMSPAPATDTVIPLTLSPTGIATGPATVTIKHGTASGTFTLKTVPVDSNATVTVTATSSGISTSTSLVVTPPTALGLTVQTQITGGSTGIGNVTLNGAAGPSGVSVSLTSKNTSVATVPATVTIPEGATTASFNISTTDPTATTTVEIDAAASALGLTATPADTSVTRSTTLEIAFDSSSVTGGDAAALTINLGSNPSGTTVKLASSNAAILLPRASVTIPKGVLTMVIGIPTAPALNLAATLTASIGTTQSATATLTVAAPTVIWVSCPVRNIVGGSSTYAQTILNGSAPAGFTVPCASSSSSVTIASPYAFTKGSSIAEIPVKTLKVTTTTTATITISGLTFLLNLLP